MAFHGLDAVLISMCAFFAVQLGAGGRRGRGGVVLERRGALCKASGEVKLRFACFDMRGGAQLCWHATRGACPEPLAVRPLSDFSDDGSGAAERTYRHVICHLALLAQDALTLADPGVQE
jgi:hypothetical protein